MKKRKLPLAAEVIIVGGGLAGLSAAVYLARAKRDTLVIDNAKSMARWEPDVQNYLGFPHGVHGAELLRKSRMQAKRFGARFTRDCIVRAHRTRKGFRLQGQQCFYSCDRLLLATGIFHIPPDIPGVTPCLGHSMFFCKDCDGYRIQGKTVAIYGWTNEAVEYALGVLLYSPRVLLVTDGRAPAWDPQHEHWVREYKVPVLLPMITNVVRSGKQLRKLQFTDNTCVDVDALFTTRGDVYYNELAKALGAKVNEEGEIVVDLEMRTSVKSLYAAGCVSPANCQMIIAAGQGATAAQTINRDLFEASLASHSLRRFRHRQVKTRQATLKWSSAKQHRSTLTA